MILSIPVSIRMLSTNVVDATEQFVTTMHRNFSDGYRLQFGGYRYQNVGDTIKIPVYDSEYLYSEGDLAFKDGTIQKVYAVDELSPLQPEDYTLQPDNLVYDASLWIARYVKLFSTFTDGSTYTVGGYKHTFYDNVASGGEVVQIVEELATGEQWTFNIPAELAITNDSAEWTPEIYANGFYKFGYMIKRGSVLYARTSVNPSAAQPEYVSVTGADFKTISHISELGGFVRIEPTLDYAPMDDEHNTVARRAGTMTYTVKCYGKFDTLALGKVIGDTVTAVFKDPAGTIVKTVPDYAIDGRRDVDRRQGNYGTTVILYSGSDIEAGGTIEITITGGLIELGSILAGLSVDAGITDLVFSNAFKDFSPEEVDAFGKVTYINGVRVMEHTGTVRMPIAKYDMTNRLLISLGGNTIILNGSDTTNNEVPDNETTFSSTMIVGRWKTSELKTALRDSDIDQFVSFGFTIRERI